MVIKIKMHWKDSRINIIEDRMSLLENESNKIIQNAMQIVIKKRENLRDECRKDICTNKRKIW